MRELACILVFSLCLIGTSLCAKSPTDFRIDPPNWFVGFENTALQLLIHSENISLYEVTLDHPGVDLLKSESCQNPNYLFLTINIESSAQAGKLELKFKRGKKSFSYDYQLLERESSSAKFSGLDQSDLIYLLFPDRFSNGNEENDCIKGMNEMAVNRDSMFSRHGGDIQGIRNHLSYLEELGITALWINPLVENNQPKESYHGYAVSDCYKIDPRFGSLNEYVNLSEEAHSRGIKMIMDVVLNHWGNEHWIIKDLPDSSWLNNWDSFERTTYRATTLLDPYASEADKKRMSNGWFDHHMPDLNQKNPLLAKYLIQNHIWWIETANIDAIRIDTYAYPDQLFMAEWASSIRAEYPNLSLFAETWVHGTPVQAWFVDDTNINREFDSQLESVTDFQLHYSINKSLSESEGWTEGSRRLYYTLAKDALYQHPEKLVTFVDNHDLSRFYSVVNEDLNSFFMGMGFLLTTRGIPSIYYGTEILMKNYADPDGKVREDFPGGWAGDAVSKFDHNNLTEQEANAFDFIKTLSTWRQSFSDLATAELTQFVPEDGVYVYFRETESKVAMVCLNFNPIESALKTARFNEILNGLGEGLNVLSGEKVEITASIVLPKRSFSLFEFDK